MNITLETSKLAKGLGVEIPSYDIYCKEYGFCHISEDYLSFIKDGKPQGTYDVNGDFSITEKWYLPKQSDLQDLIRDNYKIHIEILLEEDFPYEHYYYRVLQVGKYFTLSHDAFKDKDYRKVLEQGLIKALKIIKDEKENSKYGK